jgi:hypothetical protein
VEAEIDPATKPLVLWLNGGEWAAYLFPISEYRVLLILLLWGLVSC